MNKGRHKQQGRMRSRAVTILAVAMLVIGVGLFSFPYTEQLVYNQNSANEMRRFDERVEQLKVEAIPLPSTDGKTPRYLSDLYEKMQQYNEEIYEAGQSGLIDPFSYEEPSFELAQWGVEDEIFGYIDIPAMDAKLPILLGANNENMKLGAVHLSQTSLPIGGINTNCVLAGHRGYHGAVMFRNIENMQVGDELKITNLWETLTYRCTETKVILPSEVEEVLIQPGRDMVTLFSCHPFRHNYQRYVIYCERVTQEG